jgi:hypothetical protein
MLCVPSEVSPFGSCAACRQRSISISQGGHDHLRRRHQQLFTGAVQRLGDQALLGRTHRRGAVQRLGAAQADRNPPAKARKSLSALGCKCTIRMRRAARSPKLRVYRGGGREKAFCNQFPPLQLQHLQIGTYEELQCCRSIANTPKDLMCLQSAIAAEQCSAAIAEYCLQLQEAPLQL